MLPSLCNDLKFEDYEKCMLGLYLVMIMCLINNNDLYIERNYPSVGEGDGMLIYVCIHLYIF